MSRLWYGTTDTSTAENFGLSMFGLLMVYYPFHHGSPSKPQIYVYLQYLQPDNSLQAGLLQRRLLHVLVGKVASVCFFVELNLEGILGNNFGNITNC